MTTYNEQLVADHKQEEQAALEQRNNEVFEVVLRTVFPRDRVVQDCEAVRKMLLEYCSGEFTLEKVSRAIANPPQGYNFGVIKLDRARQAIIDEICELESAQRITEFQARQNRIKYEATFSLGQLRARLVELLLKAEWGRKSVSEIHAELATMRESKSPVWRDPHDGRVYEKLPATLEGLPAGEFLRHAAKFEFPKFRRIVERYGAPQVTVTLRS
jgi:hypothetical protein